MHPADKEVLQALADRHTRRAILPTVISEREVTAIYAALSTWPESRVIRPGVLRPQATPEGKPPISHAHNPDGCDDPICQALGRGMEHGRKERDQLQAERDEARAMVACWEKRFDKWQDWRVFEDG